MSKVKNFNDFNEDEISNEKNEVRMNPKFNSLEVKFDEKPERSVLDKLKDAGFKWSQFNKVWYKEKFTKKDKELAQSLTENFDIGEGTLFIRMLS